MLTLFFIDADEAGGRNRGPAGGRSWARPTTCPPDRTAVTTRPASVPACASMGEHSPQVSARVGTSRRCRRILMGD